MDFNKWYKNGAKAKDLSWEEFKSLLDLVEFEIIEEKIGNGRKVYRLRDYQNANLGGIEDEVFCVEKALSEENEKVEIQKKVIDRMEAYFDDILGE